MSLIVSLYRGNLQHLGYAFGDAQETAQMLVLFNTCSVREQAENKVLKSVSVNLGIEKNDGSEVVVGMLGCLPEREGKRLIE